MIPVAVGLFWAALGIGIGYFWRAGSDVAKITRAIEDLDVTSEEFYVRLDQIRRLR